ncbi:MAG TPA: histidine kinase [Pseudonocardiaceae bacterium]|nr:histidine kinase [Pseudonocardiaceae bacterium]
MSTSTTGRAAIELPGLTRLRGWLARHPLLSDAAKAVVLFVFVMSKGGHGASGDHILHGPPWLMLMFAVLLCGPLVLRRRYPVGVFAAMCVVASVQWLVGYLLVADAALLIGLYTVAAQSQRRAALAAAGVLEIGVGMAVLRWTTASQALPLFIFLSGLVAAAFLLGINVRTRRDYLASLEDRAVRAERERDQQAEIAAARERARIAREMHDIVAHNLSVMIALADGAAFAARTGSPDAESAARQVSDTGRQALGEMHRLLGVLRDGDPASPRTPQPGIGQVDDLVAQVRAAGLEATWTVSGTPFPVPSTAELALFRMIQEALTNVLKHARQATEARVLLRYDAPVIDIRIVDDGHSGSSTGSAGSGREPVHGGHGLIGMRERAAMFGGSVSAGPRPGHGWQVHARLDVDAAPSEPSQPTDVSEPTRAGQAVTA